MNGLKTIRPSDHKHKRYFYKQLLPQRQPFSHCNDVLSMDLQVHGTEESWWLYNSTPWSFPCNKMAGTISLPGTQMSFILSGPRVWIYIIPLQVHIHSASSIFWLPKTMPLLSFTYIPHLLWWQCSSRLEPSARVSWYESRHSLFIWGWSNLSDTEERKRELKIPKRKLCAKWPCRRECEPSRTGVNYP